MATEIVLSYKLKCFPTRNKADTLTLLSGLFCRLHSVATQSIADTGQYPTSQGKGEFTSRAHRRAWSDYKCGQKSARVLKQSFKVPTLKAELIDAAQVQEARKAKGFDYWIMIHGTTTLWNRKEAFYIPARKHRAINRTLALPGAVLNKSAEVFRKNSKWYAHVSVSIPLVEIREPKGWLGCDIGARAVVTRSDGYRGPDLRPLFNRDDERKQNHAKQGLDRQRPMSPSRQVVAKEARNAVTVCLRSGRGIALEDPKRLVRWKKHAARFFGKRVLLLAAIHGLAVSVISPPYTSTTCSHCGYVERRQRHREAFRCWRCGFTHNADFNAALNICHKAYTNTGVSHGLLSLLPGGGAVE